MNSPVMNGVLLPSQLKSALQCNLLVGCKCYQTIGCLLHIKFSSSSLIHWVMCLGYVALSACTKQPGLLLATYPCFQDKLLTLCTEMLAATWWTFFIVPSPWRVTCANEACVFLYAVSCTCCSSSNHRRSVMKHAIEGTTHFVQM